MEAHFEKLRIAEALLARDHAIHRMESICTSLRQRESTITRLEQDKAELEAKVAAYTQTPGGDEKPGYIKEIERLHATNKELHAKIRKMRQEQEEAEETRASKENSTKVKLHVDYWSSTS